MTYSLTRRSLLMLLPAAALGCQRGDNTAPPNSYQGASQGVLSLEEEAMVAKIVQFVWPNTDAAAAGLVIRKIGELPAAVVNETKRSLYFVNTLAQLSYQARFLDLSAERGLQVVRRPFDLPAEDPSGVGTRGLERIRAFALESVLAREGAWAGVGFKAVYQRY